MGWVTGRLFMYDEYVYGSGGGGRGRKGKLPVVDDVCVYVNGWMDGWTVDHGEIHHGKFGQIEFC
jgi:hypothetical protein